ncbi:MAG: hypothetical protein R2788_27330 [Saprospiraceae bacterium]
MHGHDVAELFGWISPIDFNSRRSAPGHEHTSARSDDHSFYLVVSEGLLRYFQIGLDKCRAEQVGRVVYLIDGQDADPVWSMLNSKDRFLYCSLLSFLEVRGQKSEVRGQTAFGCQKSDGLLSDL